MAQTVLITGANRGLGYDLANTYLENGWIVYAGSRKQSERLNDLQAQYGAGCRPITLDVSSDESVQKAAHQVENECGHVNVLINNAAVHLEQDKPFLPDLDLDAALEMFNVNAIGSLRVSKHFLSLLTNANEPVLVNISSEAGSIQNCKRNREYGYCMSKAAVNMQTKILRNDLVPKAIQILAIHPGWMRTDMGGPKAHIAAKEAAEGIYQLIIERRTDFEAPWYIDYTGKPLEV